MTYAETINYLYHHLPMFSKLGAAAYKKDLTNIKALCAALGNPHQQFKSIHIAGTNGKGSVSHMLASVLHTAGYKTGLYTSPHLYDFRERIKIDGAMISQEDVVKFVALLQPQIETTNPSFFEVTVAMAFWYFAQQGVDVAVVEVGLGGRLDSTNIITPLLSVITNISFDHQAILGNTLPEIAAEKAGIIKPGVPVVIGERHPETESVFLQKAAIEGAPITFAQDVYAVPDWSMQSATLSVEVVSKKEGVANQYQLDLPGIYQTKNLLPVLCAVDALRKHFDLPQTAVQRGLAEAKRRTGLGGRWEVVRQNPTVVLDVAHNEGGIRQMLQTLVVQRYEKLFIIYGTAKDKDYEAVIHMLPAAEYHYTQAQMPRALPAAELARVAARLGKAGASYDHVDDAVKAVLQRAAANDLVLICGSIFLIAEVDKRLLERQPSQMH